MSKYDELRKSERFERVVDCPEWGTSVRLVKLSELDRLKILALQTQIETDENGEIVNNEDLFRVAIELLALSITEDESNERPFNDESGRLFLSRADLNVINRLGSEAIQLNGLGAEDKGIEEAKKD